MEDDIIPILGSVSYEVDTGEALEELIRGLQMQAAFSYCFLSAEMNNKSNIDVVSCTLKELNGIGRKLSKTYLIKAANIYHEHLNDRTVQKTEEEYFKEAGLAGSMIDFVAELNPDMKLHKENSLTYGYQCDPKNVVLTMIINSFPRNIVNFVNESIADSVVLIDYEKKLGPREKKVLEEIFGAQKP